jgi:structural maintenance of chromosome 1
LLQFTFFLIPANVERWERTVQDDEDALETYKQTELRQRQEIEKDKQRIEQLKAEKVAKKASVDQMEEETARARRDVQTLAKELHTVNQQMSSIEAKMETKKNERHNLLMQAKMDDIQLPMTRGTMDDIVQNASSENQDANSSTATNSSSAIYEREANL